MSILHHAIQAATTTFLSLHTLDEPLGRAAQMVEKCVLNGHKLLVCGNGGSAADGADFSTEFACRFISDRRPYPALNLSAGGSLMTAIGNDYNFDEVFARQVWGFGKEGDVLVAISTSGNSRNILRALAEAKRKKLGTLALLGKDGGAAKGLADVELIVPQHTTARIQEAHKFLLHVLCEMIEGNLQRD
ncbi:MAG TPA: SIS domain-containing protein [Chthoniobacteraceae bacterium]|nr:SIS domain-containing protein [Chthoniobacteraceae bacterium]